MEGLVLMLDRALKGAGAPAPDLPTLIPLSVILDVVGEEVRPRLCVLNGEGGEETCLRPDFTLPLAMNWQGLTGGQAQRWRYWGPAFRHPPEPAHSGAPREQAEFIQAGFEWFGAPPEDDAAALALALEAAYGAGLDPDACALRLGDAALFPAIVDALALGSVWASRLKRAFATKAGPLPLVRSGQAIAPPQGLGGALAGLSAQARADVVEGLLSLSGLEPVSGRTADVIAARLARQAEAAEAGPLPEEARAVLERVLTFSGSLDHALGVLEALAASPGLDGLVTVTEAFARRRQGLAELAPAALKTGVFSASFGRRFDYYDGFLFELTHRALGPHRAVMSGGRYDGLVARLSGGKADVPAIGAVLRPARIAEALGSGGKQ